MAWPLLKWLRSNRRGKAAHAAGTADRPGSPAPSAAAPPTAPPAAFPPVAGGRMSDETMLQTTGLRLPGLAAPSPDSTDPAGLALFAGLPEAPPGSAFLLVRQGPQAGARFLLDAPVTGAGRSAKQDILLDDATVSRAHAEFVRIDGGFMVRDLNSLNGTYVGTERVAEAVLRPGDVIRIGKFRLTYHPGPQSAPPDGGYAGTSSATVNPAG